MALNPSNSCNLEQLALKWLSKQPDDGGAVVQGEQTLHVGANLSVLRS